jgi:hypothetical protein
MEHTTTATVRLAQRAMDKNAFDDDSVLTSRVGAVADCRLSSLAVAGNET